MGVKLLWYIKGVGIGSAPEPQEIYKEIFFIYLYTIYGYYFMMGEFV